jgi:DNA invertase Pin-like site-specific DNA recombinase
MRVALYTRVSTADQSVAMQLDELRSYCERRGLEIAEEYSDVLSGAAESRPSLTRLMADARRRKFDAVLVYRFDRFARSLTHLVRALADFDALGVNFISLHEAVDTSTPSGRLIFAIFAGLSEFERSLIRERVISGQASARRRGVRFGRPRVSIDAGAIKELRLQGKSFPAIAKELHLSVGTVFRTAKQA